MERKFYTDDFEQLLKERTDEFRMYPSKRVWHSIYNDLHPGRKWPSIAVSLILIIALLMVGYWNDNSAVTITAADTPKNLQPLFASLNKSNAVTITKPDYTVIPGDIKKLPAQNNTAKNSQAKNNSSKINSPYNTVFSAANNYLSFVNKTNTGQKPVVEENAIAILQSGNIIGSIIFNAGKETTPLLAINENSILITDAVIAKARSLSMQQAAASTKIQVKIPGTTTKKPVNNQQKNSGIIESEIAEKDNNAETTISLNNIDKTSSGDPGLNSNNSKNNASDSAANSEIEKNTRTLTSAVTETSDRMWIEDYAFHNKSKRKAWQDRTALGFYITPGVGYRNLSNNSKYNSNGGDANKSVDHTAGVNFEAGFNVNYAIAKKIRVTAGLQANYTSYGIHAQEINHPVLTTLMLLDPNSGYPYQSAASTTLANTQGYKSAKIHNTTYQVSIPIGVAVKLSGNDKLEWYAGATIQPTFVVAGKAYVISSDRKNYVADPSLIRKWNLNTSVETYINYKFNNFTLQAGPQFRYQLLSTYYKKYTVNENLYNLGLKIGILKNF